MVKSANGEPWCSNGFDPKKSLASKLSNRDKTVGAPLCVV
jgi:hypothetical protein